MILLIILGALTTIGVLLIVFTGEFSSLNTVGQVIAVFSGIVLLVALIALPVNYYSTKAEVDRYHALKETIEEARRGEVSEIERAALIQEIAGYNKDLASAKFWNDTLFDIYIFDGLTELEFLK